MNNQEEFIVKRVTENNLNDLVYLMSLEHENHKKLDYFFKKFSTTYTGKKFIGHLAYDQKGEPAAFYGAYPLLITDGECSFLGGQIADTITNPKFQRRGLFIKLATITHKVAKEEGMKLVFGFPNPNIAPGYFNKLDWIHLGRFTIFKNSAYKNLNIYNVLNKYNFSKPIYKFYFSIIYSFIKTDFFENSNLESGNYTVDRNREYFRYKKYEKSFLVKIDNFKFWIKFGDGIIIGDVEKFDLNLRSDFNKSLKKLTKILGVKTVTVQAMPDTFLFSLFSTEFSSDESIEIGALFLDEELKYKGLKFSEGDCDTF